MAALVALLWLPGCTTGNDVAVADGSTPTPTPATLPPSTEPIRTPRTVVGERIPAAHWVSSTGVLDREPATTRDPDTVLPLVHAVADWLDGHLDDLQRGGSGHLPAVTPATTLAGADPTDLDAVTTRLTEPDRPVASATYHLDASYEAATEWVTATVVVADPTGQVRAATLVFVPAADGPELVLFGPATPEVAGTAAPAGTP